MQVPAPLAVQRIEAGARAGEHFLVVVDDRHRMPLVQEESGVHSVSARRVEDPERSREIVAVGEVPLRHGITEPRGDGLLILRKRLCGGQRHARVWCVGGSLAR
jgi:hypothetical protein